MNSRNSILLYAIIFIGIFVPSAASAQQNKYTYEGTIVSAQNGSKLENVICQALDQKGEVIFYTFSNAKGHFSIPQNDNINHIQFKLLGYTTLTVPGKHLESSANLIIELSESPIPIEEIVVKVPPIRQDNDTIKYNVNSFKTQGDRYLSDVLKKLPGVKVSENGTISYMGESINKFYIEGRDLLGGQYNIATNNLDINAVSTIEVLQNNQHIKALKGIDFEEKSAINIKLKKGHKARPFGNIQLGAGGTPFLHEVKGLSSYIDANRQTIANIKSQNTGTPILNEIEDKLDINNLFSYEATLPPFVTAPAPRYVPLPTNRHLFNNTRLGSISTLIPTSQNGELKLHVAYGKDKKDQDFFLLQNIATDTGYIHISELSKQREKDKTLKASIAYELNSSGKYIKNETLYLRKNKDSYALMDTHTDSIGVLGLNNVQYVQNSFQGLFKTQNDKAVQVHSLLRFESDSDELDKNSPISNYISELFKTKYWIAKNKVGSSFNILKNKLNIDLFATYRQKDIDNFLTQQGKNVEQYTTIKRLQIGLDPTYQIRYPGGNLFITLDLPVWYDHYSVNDTDREKVIFSPSIKSSWIVNHQWEAFIKAEYSYDYANDISLLESPYFSGYRNIYSPNKNFNDNSYISLVNRLQYKDIVNMFFFNINTIYKWENRNYINVFYNTNEYSYHTTKEQNNNSEMFTIIADIAKTLPKEKLSLAISPSYTTANSNIIQQNIATKNRSHITSISTKADWNPTDRINIIYNATGKIVHNKNNLARTKPLRSITQNLRLFYFPTKEIDVLCTSDYAIYEKTDGKYSQFFFLDLKGSYKHKKIEYELTLHNILNNNLFSLSELSSVNTYHQQIPLRKRAFLASIRFNF